MGLIIYLGALITGGLAVYSLGKLVYNVFFKKRDHRSLNIKTVPVDIEFNHTKPGSPLFSKRITLPEQVITSGNKVSIMVDGTNFKCVLSETEWNESTGCYKANAHPEIKIGQNEHLALKQKFEKDGWEVLYK